MHSLKEELQELLKQDICVSINGKILTDKTFVENLEIRDDAHFMLDYIWNEDGSFLRLNYHILDSDLEP